MTRAALLALAALALGGCSYTTVCAPGASVTAEVQATVPVPLAKPLMRPSRLFGVE